MKALIGRKIGMGQLFQNDEVIPVTLIQAGPVTVTQIKTQEKDGYEAVQVGFETIVKEKKITKSKKQKPFAYIQEFRGMTIAEEEAKNPIDVSVFEEGDKIRVSSVSKGKGFQGGVKRHGFAGRNSTHGVKHEQRTIGSTGQSFPERVIKGRRMPGRMGADRVSVKNLKIVKVDKEHNVLAVAGAVPGPNGALVEIQGI